MKILVNVFHPDLNRSTVNKRWVEELRNHSNITLNIAYEQYSDWKINVEREQQLLLEHDRIVFQHPFYWYSTPPLMKKWFDDVLTYAWAYGPGGTALKGKEWVSAISTGGPAEAYQAGGYNNYSMSELLKPLQQVANLTGMIFLPSFLFQGTVVATKESIEQSAQDYLTHICNPELNPQVRLQRILKEMATQGVTLES
jgi:glutathione-regulated potassium-efflux system ancillary protein KefG